MAQPVANVPRGTLPHLAPSVPRGTLPVAYTPWSLDAAARSLGTDRKTLLLVGVLGLVGGYLLNDAIKMARRTVKRSARRTRKLAGQMFTPRNLVIAGVAGLGLGAAYWYYRQHHGANTPSTAVAHPAVKAKLQLPTRAS